jgi:hypothetical protein
MPGDDKALTLVQLIKQTLAGAIIANRDNQSIVGDVGKISNTPQDGQAE